MLFGCAFLEHIIMQWLASPSQVPSMMSYLDLYVVPVGITLKDNIL